MKLESKEELDGRIEHASALAERREERGDRHHHQIEEQEQ